MPKKKKSTNIIDGNKIAERIKKEVKKEIEKLAITPGLAVILVGQDPASHLYVKLKEKAAKEVGVRIERKLFFHNTPQEEIIRAIKELNKKPSIHGIIVQLPLPHHLDEDAIIKAIAWQKDVDGFHPFNIKNLLEGNKVIEPVLIKVINEIIKHTKFPLKKKKVCLLANSETFIMPLKYLLEKKGAEVIVKKSGDYFKNDTREADIVIIAYGRPRVLKAEDVKENSLIIDIGINRENSGEVVGDVDFEEVKRKVKFITPVPGGVGPITVAMVLKNTLESAKLFKAEQNAKL